MRFADAPSRARRKALPGDVVVSTVRTYLKAVAAVNDQYSDCVFSTGFAVLRARNLNYSFLKWMTLNELVIQAIEAHSEGLSYPAINASALVKLKTTVPPPDEQVTIAAFLDRETARIDTLIQKKTRFIELLKEKIVATAMAEQMYGDGELIRLRYLTQIISRPVEIIDGDEYVALGLYNRGRGLFHKPPTLGKNIGDSDFFYVKEGDLILSGQFAWEGALTMASSNENGCVVSHRYPVIRGKTVPTEYLLALLMTNFGDFLLNESSRGSAGRNRPLNINLLLNEKVRMPSPKAQQDVRRLINLKAKLETKVLGSIRLLKERRAALITAAVTGQIDLRGEQ
ncbi:restriction endonuclease subunit S [Nitrosococcus wardiae]|uniref:Restriction endonuclease subunit S n=2 Tax=Nitrosococcus wardiae TaxID=1814290 RepID=A0A4P7C3U5_9GAMM|nr:restriction endonuclease subunit S [Nitrosococcus wardiae]